ncbi:MAG: beta-galactosidase [Chloroflexi bacterium]|nr:beta-galactosidase [Chloroflexota bacterium]
MRDVQQRLGRGGPYLRVGFSGVFRYMAEVDPADDDRIVPRRLEEIVAAARAANAPFLVHLNGGRWAGGGPLVERLMANPDLMAWDHLGQPWSYRKDGEYHFSLGAHNDTWRAYKQRNLQAAAQWLADFARGPDGQLLVGVSTDSEVLINTHEWSDYNPLVLEEYVQWLSSDALYGPNGRWAGQGLGLGLKGLNERYGTSFPRWKDVQPPREKSDTPYWTDWQRFRRLLVDHNVQEQVDWIREAGIPGDRVFSHQSPELNVEVFADALDAAQVDSGSTGITTYGEQTGNRDLFERVRAYGARWGIFEYNPLTNDSTAALAALDLARGEGASVICPYHWDDLGGPNEVGYTIRGTPFETALRRFVRAYWSEPAPTVR